MKEENNKPIRVRFAPSPSGFFHVGSARTALFNYLFAKHNKGVFILRIEDTNQETSKLEYEQDIIESLLWLGIEWDEGPIPTSFKEAGEFLNSKSEFLKNVEKNYVGEYGPYKQSERLNIYKKYIEQLLKENKAYYCFCEKEELEAQRQYQLSKGEAPKYSGKCANLTQKEITEKKLETKNSTIRLKTISKKIKFKDIIRDELEFDTAIIGDFIIAKAENGEYSPLYNLAATIDDFEMQISHIIRGEDLISSTPRQILIQEALAMPALQYAHLPLILDENRAKLSKRQGATSIREFKELGYLPEAMMNFIAFLGWNPGDDREVFYKPSLIKEFSLERTQKGGAIFNTDKLNHLNGFYIRQKSPEKITELCIPHLVNRGLIEEIKEQ